MVANHNYGVLNSSTYMKVYDPQRNLVYNLNAYDHDTHEKVDLGLLAGVQNGVYDFCSFHLVSGSSEELGSTFTGVGTGSNEYRSIYLKTDY